MPSTEPRHVTSRRSARTGALAATALVLILWPAPGAAEQAPASALQGAAVAEVVCAEVVLAIDGSRSTKGSAFGRQLAALDAALRDARVHRAIQDCLPGSVAVSALSWSSAGQQELCVEWRVVTGPAQARGLAHALGRECRYIGGTTDIGRALEAALALLDGNSFESYYRIVFLFTNGRTDEGAEKFLATARAAAAGAGVTTDGFALLGPLPRHPPPGFVDDGVGLARYVAGEVSAGPRAFTAAARPGEDRETLVRALIEMLRQELH